MNANRWPGISDQVTARIEAALARGKKIEAIKIYRQETNCGLKEAKEAIEAGDDRTFGTAAAQGRSARTSGPNWLTMVLILIVVGIFLAAILFAMR